MAVVVFVAAAAATILSTTLWLHVKFNFILFTLRPFTEDLFTRNVTARLSYAAQHHHHHHYHHLHENTMSQADSFDLPLLSG